MSRYLKGAGARIRPPGNDGRGRVALDVNKISAMNRAGMTLSDIGENLGVSDVVISRRLKEAGYLVVINQKKSLPGTHSGWRKTLAKEIGASCCTICAETREIDLCHIQARKMKGPFTAKNVLPLCPTHHRCFDRKKLYEVEVLKILPKLKVAADSGYHHKHYHP